MNRAVCLWILVWIGGIFSTFGQVEKNPLMGFRTWDMVEEKKFKVRIDLADSITVENVSATADGIPMPTKFVPFGAPGESDRVSLIFLIDKSDPKRARTIDAAKALTQQLIERSAPHTESAVYAFDANLDLVADFGTPWAEVAAKLKTVKAAGMATELYRNAIEAIGILGKRETERRALIIFSDGKAEDTTYRLEKVVEEATKAGVVIYGIGYAENPQSTIYLQSLRRLATESNGLFAEADMKTRLVPAAFVDLVQPTLRSGGYATIDVAANKTAKEVELTIAFAGGQTMKRSLGLEKLVPPPIPAPDPKAEEMAKKVAEMAKKVEDVANQVKEVPAKVDEAARKAEEERKAAEEKQKAQEIAETAELARQANATAKQLEREAATRRFWILFFSGLVVAAAAVAVVKFFGKRPAGPDAPETAGGPAVVFARLQVLDGDATEHRMTTTALRIGRGKDNDLTLGNDSVSRHHAEISRTREGLFTITELNAGNGVLVNGKEVDKAVLQHEDIIELGEVRIRFLIAEGQPRTVMT